MNSVLDKLEAVNLGQVKLKTVAPYITATKNLERTVEQLLLYNVSVELGIRKVWVDQGNLKQELEYIKKEVRAVLARELYGHLLEDMYELLESIHAEDRYKSIDLIYKILDEMK